jgi:hypothetical protein
LTLFVRKKGPDEASAELILKTHKKQRSSAKRPEKIIEFEHGIHTLQRRSTRYFLNTDWLMIAITRRNAERPGSDYEGIGSLSCTSPVSSQAAVCTRSGPNTFAAHPVDFTSIGSRIGVMELELQAPFTLAPNTFSVLVAPEEVLADSLNGRSSLQRIQALYVCGNYSRILDRLDRRFSELNVRRAFTAYQLVTILKEAYQTLIIFEHDPSLFEDASEMAEYAGQALKEAAGGSAVLLYSPWADRHLEEISRSADRVFVFNQVPKRIYKRASKKIKPDPEGQRTLEAF